MPLIDSCSLVSAFQTLFRALAACLVASCHCSLFSLATVFTESGFHFCAASFPDCGCKITAFFRRVQVFLKLFCNFTVFAGIRGCISVESKNVKISFGLLTRKACLEPFPRGRALISFGEEKNSRSVATPGFYNLIKLGKIDYGDARSPKTHVLV